MDKKCTSGARVAVPGVRASGALKKAGAIMALAKRGQIDKAYACLEAVYIEYTRLKVDVPNDYILVHLALLGAEVAIEQRRA